MTPLQPGPLSPGMVTSRPDIQDGEPCITGTRVPARAIKSFHDAGYTLAQIHREYPGLTDEQLEAAIAFDGWITAPPGGWGSNPVGDRVVEWRDGYGASAQCRAEELNWSGKDSTPVIAFRLVDEATGESGSLADARTHRATEGAVLDKEQLKAIERAAMDAGCTAWRRCRLAMVEGDQIVGYPAFSRADMAELARLYREDDVPSHSADGAS